MFKVIAVFVMVRARGIQVSSHALDYVFKMCLFLYLKNLDFFFKLFFYKFLKNYMLISKIFF
jgi:hypothetical protein